MASSHRESNLGHLDYAVKNHFIQARCLLTHQNHYISIVYVCVY